MFRKSSYLTIVCGLVFLIAGSSVFADDYFVYSTFDPPEAGGPLDSAASYVESYGVPGTWGDELQYVYFTQGSVGYKYRVWVENEGSPADPTPSYIDIKQHPDHYDPLHIGPIEPRYFEFVTSATLINGSHRDEFHIDSTGVYLGAYPNGIKKWDHDWNYVGAIANNPPEITESLAYNPGENIWYAGGRYRTIYEIRDTNNDGSFLDETWTAIFTHPDYGGGHHDGMEYVSGYLWISDMTSDVIGKWEPNSLTGTWDEIGRYYYSEPAYVEGMGFGANDHFWLTGSGSYFYELGNKITMYYPIADAGEDVDAYPPTIPLEFDASGSHHTNPERSIALYEWDFEGDGVFDYNSIDPVVEHTYPAVYNPDGSIDWAATAECYTAVLRVTDDDPVLPKTASDIRTVCITTPPWEPIADPDGPYNPRENQEVCLDGSGSFHPAAAMYGPEHPWYDEIVLWEWDLDNDGEFDDASGETVYAQWPTQGTYFICLRVTDLGGASDEKFTTVLVAPGIHDVAVDSVVPSKSIVRIGEVITVDIDVSNLGDFPETFDVTLRDDEGGEICVSSVTLASGQEQQLSCSWDTTGLTEGICTITACAAVAQGEILIENNCLSSIVELTECPPAITFDGDNLLSTGGAPTVLADLLVTLRDGDGNVLEMDGQEVTLTLVADGVGTIVLTADSIAGLASATQELEPAIYYIEITLASCPDVTATAILVIYNPEGGFATGGGWLVPADDGLNTHPDVRANFGFNAKYKKGVSTGHLEFRYSDGHIDLKSSSIEQLVITGGKIAQFKGWASVNGEAGHWFFVKAIDNGEPGTNDIFDIKVWSPGISIEGDPSERAGGVLQGGNILVHVKNK